MDPEKDKDKGGDKQVIVIGEKEYSAADVQGILDQHKDVAGKLEGLAAVTAFAERYEMDPSNLVQQAEGAFQILGKLAEAGIIDDKGNVITKPGKPAKGGEGEGDEDDLSELEALLPGLKTPAKNLPADKKDAIIVAALGEIKGLKTTVETLSQTVKELDVTQSGILRTRIEENLTKAFPNLESEDVSQIIAKATRDRSKKIEEHAKIFADKKAAKMAGLRAEHAKEFGINLEEFDANKLKEPGSEEGAVGILKGKKPSFRKGGDNVSPLKAAQEFLRRQRTGN